jgi:hypothetical protein
MIVCFVGSKSGIQGEIPYYRSIISHIKDNGHELAKDWVEEAYELARQGQFKNDSKSWQQVDKEYMKAISDADVIIVDATVNSFFSGYQVAHAILQKKPILILMRGNAPVSISGLTTASGFVKSVIYDTDKLGQIIKDFLDENVITVKDLRFNFFLDRQTYSYLRWMSAKTGKTKAEIVRMSIQRDMQQSSDNSEV